MFERRSDRNVLGALPGKVADVARSTGLRPAQVREALERLRDAGHAREADGLWHRTRKW
jgi:DNA-binding IclR family transcriptional regulator